MRALFWLGLCLLAAYFVWRWYLASTPPNRTGDSRDDNARSHTKEEV